MKIEFPPEMQKMLDENPDLEVLHVSVVFNPKKDPLTKKFKKKLAHDVYEAALAQLETLSKGSEKISPKIQKKASPKLPQPNPTLLGHIRKV